MPTILTAGDRFVLPELFQSALVEALPGHDPAFRTITSAWPFEPFTDVEEVREASGEPAELAAALDNVEIAVSQLAPFTASVFRAPTAARLRLVGICRGGPVNVNLDAATDAGVAVSFAPGRNAQAAAEFAIGMIIAAARNIPAGSAALHGGTWRGDFYAYEASGTELAGATVGLVGYGAIGSIVARILLAIGACVLVADPYADAARLAADEVELVELDELMSRSQVVSLHARLSPETSQLVDERRLGLLPRGAVLVNTARGGLLDHAPLAGLLRSGALAAVALDVYDEEPPGPDWPLLGEPSAVLTPHLAGASMQTARRAADIIAGEVRRFLNREPLQHLANPDVLDSAAYRDKQARAEPGSSATTEQETR